MDTQGKQSQDLKQMVQELKIKLMQKQRLISDNESKIKKIQFKTNRDIRELKMSEERMKNQLKQQKAKIDKVNKSLSDALQENTQIQKSLTQIKQQKEKQIQNLKSQYNNLRNEVRQYQRILPTHTFMTKLQKNYQQISTYEQIFNFLQILKQKYQQLEESSNKYRTQTQQKLQMQKKILEGLQSSKSQLEKKLKQDMVKVLQYQTQNQNLKLQNSQFRSKLEQVVYQLQKKIQEGDNLTEQNKRLQQRIEQIVKAYHSELSEKQIQIRNVMEEQYKRHQEQIQNLRRNYQSKQYAHMENLALYQQQGGRLADQIENHRQQYRKIIKNISEQLQQVKYQLQKEKKDNIKIKQQFYLMKQELILKTNESKSYLLKLSEYQQKIQSLHININNLQEILANHKDESRKKLTNYEQEKKNLYEKLNQLQTQANQMKEDLLSRQGQIQMLHGQIEQLKNKNNLYISQSITPLPTHQTPTEQIQYIRNRSKTQQFTQLDRVSNEKLQKRNQNNPQRKSEQIILIQQKQELVNNQHENVNRNWNYKDIQKQISQKMFEAKQEIQKQLKVDFDEKLQQATQNYNKKLSSQIKQKQIKQKQIQNLKKVIQQKLQVQTKYEQKINKIQAQMNNYINEIIQMKLKVANAQMKAAQKIQQYSQLQKKINKK